MAGLYEMFVAGRQNGAERRAKRTIADYMLPATRGDQDALKQVYSVDPNAGMQAQRMARQQQEDDFSDTVKAADFFLRTNDQNAYRHVRERLANNPQFAGMPESLDDPEDQAGAQKLMSALIGAYGGQKQNAGYESRFVDDQGNVVVILGDGSTKVVGKASPNMQILEGQGGFYGVNKSNLQAAPVQLGGAPQQTQNTSSTGQLDPVAEFPALAQQFGAQVTSLRRDPQRNANVGGVRNSFHLSGEAGDFVVPPARKAAFIQAARARGYEAVDEGDHVHLEPPKRGMSRSQFSQGQQLRPRDPIQDAIAKSRAEAQVKLETAPALAAIEAEAAGAREAAVSRVELEQLLPKVKSDSQSAINLIDKALNHLGRATATGMSSVLDPRNYAAGTDAKNFQVLLNQLKGKNFLQAFQSLKGGGAITQVEGQKAEEAIGRLDRAQSDEEFVEALLELRDIAASAPEGMRARINATGRGSRQSNAPVRVQSAADYEALPSGTVFIAPDGTQRRKR